MTGEVTGRDRTIGIGAERADLTARAVTICVTDHSAATGVSTLIVRREASGGAAALAVTLFRSVTDLRHREDTAIDARMARDPKEADTA